jgi:hypothetical protein
MVAQSRTGSCSQITFVTLFSSLAGVRLDSVFYQPQQIVRKCWAKPIVQSQTGMFWLFFIQFYCARGTYYWALGGLDQPVYCPTLTSPHSKIKYGTAIRSLPWWPPCGLEYSHNRGCDSLDLTPLHKILVLKGVTRSAKLLQFKWLLS